MVRRRRRWRRWRCLQSFFENVRTDRNYRSHRGKWQFWPAGYSVRVVVDSARERATDEMWNGTTKVAKVGETTLPCRLFYEGVSGVYLPYFLSPFPSPSLSLSPSFSLASYDLSLFIPTSLAVLFSPPYRCSCHG